MESKIIDSLEALFEQLKKDFPALYWYMDKQFCWWSGISSKVIRLDLGLRMNLYLDLVDGGNDCLCFIRFKLYREHDLIEYKFSQYDSLYVEIVNTIMIQGYKSGFSRNQIMLDLFQFDKTRTLEEN